MSATGLLMAKGQAVTATVTTVSYDASTDTPMNTQSTTAGYAMRIRGDAKRYEALGLTEDESPTLELDFDPVLGAELSFGGVTYRVRDVQVTAPAGTTQRARAVVTR